MSDDRPAKNVQTGPQKMPPALRDEIRAYAAQHGQMSWAAAIRLLVRRGLDVSTVEER